MKNCRERTASLSAGKKKISTLGKYVAFSIVSIIVYTVVEQYLSIRTGFERSSLTVAFFACFGGEILSCALIKVFKLKGPNGAENNDSDGWLDDGGNG